MPVYVERAAADLLTGQEIVEQLGSWLAGQYQAVETQLLEDIARRVREDMNTEDPIRRVAAIQQLREVTASRFADLDAADAARRLVDTAMTEGTAAAIESLGLPAVSPLTPRAVTAAATIGFDLTNALEDVRARVLRAVPDVYQDVMARLVGQRALGRDTNRALQRRAVTEFLSRGIPGFTDQAGRRWTIGTYAEMAGRTATNRAWLDAHTAAWSAMELHLVTIVRGSDSCARCAAWSGRILSTDGRTGEVTTEHATTGAPITITIEGTLAQARAGGWNHPNCRCTLAVVFPGLSLPANDTTYDPQRERDRERLRYLERRTREFKRRAQVSEALGDDIGAAHYRRRVRGEQERIRAHVTATKQVRKRYREQLSFADGDSPAAPPKRTGPKPIGPATPSWRHEHAAASARISPHRADIGKGPDGLDIDATGRLGERTRESLDGVRDAGRVVDREITRRLDTRLPGLRDEVDAADTAVQDILRRRTAANEADDYRLFESLGSDLAAARERRTIAEKRLASAQRDVTLEVLGEIRPMGGGARPKYTIKATDTVQRKRIGDAMDHAHRLYPDAWNDANRIAHPDVEVFHTGRGYNDRGRIIALSGQHDEILPTATHELGHSMERAVPGLRNLEWAYHYERSDKVTNPDGSIRLAYKEAIYPGTYELHIPDRWATTYTGKVYVDGSPDDSWEVFTTGVESLYDGSPYFNLPDGSVDDDHRSFILGVLSTL